MTNLIGRTEEKQTLKALYEVQNSDFLVVYGRRRVGKTFLIREYFANKFDFQLTGLANSKTSDQLINFHVSINKYSKKEYKVATSWFEAFAQLIDFLESKRTKKKVIFMDELPWLDTAKSGFLSAFEHFWNSWASARKDILLIVCGSATSWITSKIINNNANDCENC